MSRSHIMIILLCFWFISATEGRPSVEMNERFENTKMWNRIKGFSKKFIRERRSVEPTSGEELPGTEISSTTSEVHMDIDQDQLSDFLRCSECLTDCKESRNSLSYYFCASCIRNCNGNVDAFMHFFSTHQCTAVRDSARESSMMQPDMTNFPSAPTEEVASQGEDIASEYLNREFNQGRESEKSKCPSLYEMHAQCSRDLDTCTAESKKDNVVHYRSAQPVVKGEENFENEINPPTRPVVDLAPTTSQLDPKNSFQSLFPKSVKSDSTVVEQYSSRFVTIKEFNELSRRTWNTKPEDIATVKATPAEDIEQESRKALCPTTFKVSETFEVNYYYIVK